MKATGRELGNWLATPANLGEDDGEEKKMRGVKGCLPRNPEFTISINGCHECTNFCKNGKGYPRGYFSGRRYTVARYLWEKAYGPIGPGLSIRHKCDNPACINLDHIEIGTNLENVADRVSRGRSAFGERNGRAKLKESDVLFILKSSESTVFLSKMFGVTEFTIRELRKGRSWRKVVEKLAPLLSM